VFSEFAQVVIAGADLNPCVGHADERLGEVLIAKPGGAQHGASAGAIGTVNQSVAAWFWRRLSHFKSPYGSSLFYGPTLQQAIAFQTPQTRDTPLHQGKSSISPVVTISQINSSVRYDKYH